MSLQTKWPKLCTRAEANLQLHNLSLKFLVTEALKLTLVNIIDG